MRGRPFHRAAAVLTLAVPVTFCSSETSGSGSQSAPAADLLLLHGNVVTVDETRPRAEAIAIDGDRILFVGSDAEAEAYRGPETREIDLGGRLTIPGFIEGHAHFLSLGRSRMELDATGTRTYAELVERVSEAATRAAPGEWIVGRGWHQSKWHPPPEPSVRGFPVHDPLSAAAPENPVWLRHASGHASLANARAMELAGITAETPDPPGGEIVRDAHGNPTGVFIETASGLIAKAYEAARAGMSADQRRTEAMRALQLAQEEALRKGITTFHDAGVGPDAIQLYREAIASRDLKLRLWVMVSETTDSLAEVLPRVRAIGEGNHHLTVRAIKAYADGALGSRGAWLLEPYADDPGNSGLNTVPLERLRRAADLALEHGFQLCTHAIGDRANREVLDIYEGALARHPEAARDARFRIEHAQILHPADVPRFARLGVIAAMQGVHRISDGPWTPDRLGPQRTRERAFQFRRLLDAGAVVMNGTDAPVEDVDPIPSFYGAAIGRMGNGEVFNPEQRMTRMEALRSYTIDAAYGGHEEDLKGSLTPGKLADVVVLSRDILSVPEGEILGTRVLITIVGGEVVYRAAG